MLDLLLERRGNTVGHVVRQFAEYFLTRDHGFIPLSIPTWSAILGLNAGVECSCNIMRARCIRVFTASSEMFSARPISSKGIFWLSASMNTTRYLSGRRDGLTNRGSKLLPVQRITRKIPPISIAARAAVRGVLLLVGALDRLIDSYMARPRPARFFSSSLTSWNLTAGKMDELLGFTTQILGNWHPQTNITHQSDRDGSGRVVPSDVGNVLKRRP